MATTHIFPQSFFFIQLQFLQSDLPLKPFASDFCRSQKTITESQRRLTSATPEMTLTSLTPLLYLPLTRI